MKLSIGIVGLPNVGKSTLFNAITKKSVPAENYPFCTIDPSVGVVAVPDSRLTDLATMSKSVKSLPAVIEFVDIAGLVKGASEGQGLGNQFLSHIKEVDAIAEMVRIFEDGDIIHVEGGIDPVRDIGIINLELILSDMQIVDKRLNSVDRDAKRGDKGAILEKETLEKVKTALLAEKLVSEIGLTEEERFAIKGLQLLTDKPFMYILNKKAGGTNLDETNDPRFVALIEFLKSKNATWTIVDAKTEHELKDFEGQDKTDFRKELGGSDDGIDNMIKAGYKLLDLITYFTTGETETRAWTINRGWSAPMAGTAIHNDFKNKFIRAEIVAAEDLLRAGSYAAAREKGLLRIEGKEYIVKDGDVIEFRV